MSNNASDALSEFSKLNSTLFLNNLNDSNNPLTLNPIVKRRKL